MHEKDMGWCFWCPPLSAPCASVYPGRWVWVDRTRLQWARKLLHPASPASRLPLRVPHYLPLSHRLCGSPACCLVTCRSEVDIIMTGTLIGPDPVFHLRLGLAQSEWLFEVRPGLSDEVSEVRPNKQKTRRHYILIELVWKVQVEKNRYLCVIFNCSHILKRIYCIYDYFNVNSVADLMWSLSLFFIPLLH